MSRTQAVLPGGPRLSDYLSIGVIAQVYPITAVREALASCGRGSRRRRDLPAEAMMYYVVALGLFRSVSAREVLRCLLEGLRWVSSEAALRVSGKSSISSGPDALGTGAVRGACCGPGGTVGRAGDTRRVVPRVAPGGVRRFDAERAGRSGERQRFGAPGASRGRAAFPQVRLTALVEVGTRAAFAWRAGAYDESEEAQAEVLLPRLSAGMLVLADRGYCGFPLWRRATGTGADLLWRVKVNLRLPVLERFGDGSYRSVLRGSGQDRRRSRGECPVRVVEYTLADADSPIYRLATTLLDPAAAPATELAALYHERWEVETAYDEVKTHILGLGALLRSKTPDLVLQEVHGLMLAHYAVRRLIHEAARRVDEDPDRLSFVHAVRVVRRRVENPGVSPPRRAMSGFATACWTKFWKSGWSPVAVKRNPVASRRKMSGYPLRGPGTVSCLGAFAGRRDSYTRECVRLTAVPQPPYRAVPLGSDLIGLDAAPAPPWAVAGGEHRRRGRWGGGMWAECSNRYCSERAVKVDDPMNKTDFLAANQCITMAWRQTRHESPPLDEATKFRMEQGREIGEFARQLFPDGILVHGHSDRGLAETQQLIADDTTKTIFEAAFSAGVFTAKADVLNRNADGWDVIEVKSSFSNSKKAATDYVDDLAYTVMVLRRAGITVKMSALLLLSREYRYGDQVDQAFHEA